MKARVLTKETIIDVGTESRNFPDFKVGDTIEVSQIVKEGEKERIQKFAGDVIAYQKNGIATTFMVRRIGANSIGVERIFPYYSPIISDIRLVKRGKVRRSKLFYIRERVGKSARIKEKILTREQKAQARKSAKKPEQTIEN
jgi:large subunit ribosomal protein L19